MQSGWMTALKGLGMGAANAIPGVSGGTMAVVFGIYERLIAAISGAATGWRKDRRDWGQHLVFLFLLGMGAVFGLLIALTVFAWALEHHRLLTMLFFMGLILGSLPAVIQMEPIGRVGLGQMTLITLGLLAVLLLGKRPDEPADGGASEVAGFEGAAAVAALETSEARQTPTSGVLGEQPSTDYPLLFVSGMAAGAAMILPGVSGSLVMLLLGQYEAVAGAASLSDPKLDVLAVVAVGAVLGILLFAKLIMLALQVVPRSTHAFIVGLVGGSVLVLFEGFPNTAEGFFLGCLILLTGALLATLFNPKTGEHPNAEADCAHPSQTAHEEVTPAGKDSRL